MNIVNERIQHIVYGEGEVISQVDGRLSIQFFGKYGVKQFIYPDAFEKYLKMGNSDAQICVLKDLQNKKVRIEAERLRIHKEQEGADRIIMLERSRLALQKKSATKSKKSKQKK